MMLLYLSLSIFASFLFLGAESIRFRNPYSGTTDPCEPDPCTDGYICQVDNQGAYCQYIGQSLTTGQTYNINSNNKYADPWTLRWILRLIKLLATILKTSAIESPKMNPCDSNPCESPKMNPCDSNPCESPKMNPCDSNPCKFDGNCTADPTTNAATCECPFPTGGDMCEEELGGCKNCSRKGKLVLVALNDKEMNFNDSVAACHEKGLQMFQPKTPDISQFAEDFLRDQEIKNLKLRVEIGYYIYWIGLRRENETAPFKWVEDSEELGNFKNWADERPFGDIETNCAFINIFYNYKWIDYYCDVDKRFFQLCSGNYDFFPDADQ